MSYTKTECPYGSGVWLETVVNFFIYPKVAVKLTDYQLDQSKYEKRQDVHRENVYYYINQDEGINYTVDITQGLVTAIEYYPSSKSAHLRCLPAPAGGVKPTSNSDKKLKAPVRKKAKTRKAAVTFS